MIQLRIMVKVYTVLGVFPNQFSVGSIVFLLDFLTNCGLCFLLRTINTCVIRSTLWHGRGRESQDGSLLEHWQPDELEELEEIEINVQAEGRTGSEMVPVKLQVAVTEMGTRNNEAVSANDEHWKREVDVRRTADQ